jgi:hypothetical protein
MRLLKSGTYLSWRIWNYKKKRSILESVLGFRTICTILELEHVLPSRPVFRGNSCGRDGAVRDFRFSSDNTEPY